MLADLLDREHGALLDRFLELLYASSVPPSMDRERALDSAGKLLREPAAALRAPPRENDLDPDPDLSSSATEHGEQRFEIGVDLPTMVREYRGLQEAVFELIEATPECRVTIDELRALARFIMGATARAAESYARARDLEIDRQTTRHIGFLAHELRNPLGSIALGLAISKESGELKPSRTVGAIERGVARLQELVDGALIEVRLRESGEIQRERLDLRELVRDIVEIAIPEIEAKDQRVELTLDEEGEIDADRRLLRSALSNLVRNAVKFSVRGGTIHVRTRATEGRVIIEVEDACGGLPDGAVQKMFDPFVQQGRDRSGFGLGLAIASQAVRAHHGTIRVHDLPGHGCVFALDIPMHDPSETEERKGTP